MQKPEIKTLIESWDAANITTAMSILKKDKTLQEEILEYYKPLLEAIFGSTLKSLVKFPEKFDKLDHLRKVYYIENLPQGMPSFITSLSFNATRRVDSWRDSHYKKQLHINWFPKNMAALKSVTELHMEHQQYDELPNRIGELENLEVLNLLDNKLKKLPETFAGLKKLRVLILAENYSLSEIPDLSQFPDLEEVDLKWTDIATLPDGFFELKNIKKISTIQSKLESNMDIMRKIFAAFPNAIIESDAQKALAVEDNDDQNEYLDQESIYIDEFNMNRLPDALFKANAVKSLTIDCYHLTEIQDQFDQLQTLEKLEIRTGHDAEVFPISIYTLKNLKELRIEGKFKVLPEGIDALESLEILELYARDLEILPTSFSKLKNLRTLEFKFVSFPIFSEISQFNHLEKLSIEDYYGTFKIKEPLANLVNLKEFKLDTDNSITDDIYKLPNSITYMVLEVDFRSTPKSALSFGKFLNHFNKMEHFRAENIDFSNTSEPLQPNTSLWKLVLRAADIKNLPHSFSNLTVLREISFTGCPLEALDPSLYDCLELKYVEFRPAQFTTIPEGISKLKNLVWLELEYGALEKLPEDILQLTQLKKLALTGSPLFADKNFKARIKKKIKEIKFS